MSRQHHYDLIDEAKNRMPLPAKINIGARNIRVSTLGANAALGRSVQAAFDSLAQDFRAFCDKLEGFLPEDMTAALDPTLELSKVYCPKLTGALVESAYLETQPFRGGVRAEIGYARNEQPPYAIAVHELPAQHEPPTRDKFLQVAIEEDYFNIVQRVADRVRIRIGGG